MRVRNGRALLHAVALAVVLSVPQLVLAAQVVGIQYVTMPMYNAVLTLPGIDNILPFQLTAPENNFSANGALAGYSELQVREAVVVAVQNSFRRAEIGQPGRMLHVDIRSGTVAPTVGTVHLIGKGFADLGVFGVAYPTGATFRPDLQPNSAYTNELSVTLADAIDRIPLRDPLVQFNTFDQVVYAIAGTVAHEIAHTLNVWEHEPGVPVGGRYPIMASGATALPLAARLSERYFLNLPNTQYANPGPPPGGPLNISTPETLIRAAGTTAIADFNFSGLVDGVDFDVWNTYKFQVGTNVKSGDANDDGLTDGQDFNIWNAQKFGGGLAIIEHESPDYFQWDVSSGELAICGCGDEIVSFHLELPENSDFLATPHLAEILDGQRIFAGRLQWIGEAAFASQDWQPLGRLVGDTNLAHARMIGSLIAEFGTADGRIIRTHVGIVPEPYHAWLLVMLGLAAAVQFRRKQTVLSETGAFTSSSLITMQFRPRNSLESPFSKNSAPNYCNH